MKQFRFKAEEEFEGSRIDLFLSEQLEDRSRSYLQKLLKSGAVTVSGQIVKPSYKLSASDEILLSLPDHEIPRIEPENIPLDIVYEDNDILLVNKPKDMVVHPAPGHYSHTLVNAVLFHCRDSLSGINGVLRPGIVHRIDKDTSGLLVICKNDAAHRSLADQLATHSITRMYRAICIGTLSEDTLTIGGNIGRSPADRKKMAVLPSGGKPAITHVKVIERLSKGFTFIECRLETGRTHQIRVHMASIGHPLLGDFVYGPKRMPVKVETGQVLHAQVLGFLHPATGSYMEFSAPLPEEFQSLLNRLR